MRIAQVAPIIERVPPPGYGGIELVVAHLTDELVRRGHDVTLFASGDSQTLAHLEAVVPQSLRANPESLEPVASEILHHLRVRELADRFDLIHFHTGLLALPFAEALPVPAVHTIHGGFNADNRPLYRTYRHQSYISISDVQQAQLPELNYVRTAHNGIDIDTYPFCETPQDPPHLAFLGRLSPEKGPHRAIEIARATGLPLRLAGKVDRADLDFFESVVKPQIDGHFIQYWGELDSTQKPEFLGQASVVLFPIDWEEPFGLVPVEAMAAGTPVVALKRGAVVETVVHGQTGFACDSLEAAIAAVPEALQLDRARCREFAARYFSFAKMTDRYEAAYRKVLADRTPAIAPTPAIAA